MGDFAETSRLPASTDDEPAAARHLPAAPTHAHDALPKGAIVGEFEIIRVLGAGGFGIVYLALDQALLRYVAIKEYLPSSLATRGKDAMVSVRSTTMDSTFALGMDSFINEARLLASFDHPSLVKVHRFWKANGTAYMVMQYYPGQTLKDARRAMTAPPGEPWLRAFIEPLLGALDVLHQQGVYHRDIAPDNVLLLPDGRPVVLDFGSARRVISDRTQSLTAVLKPNFSPVEQYADEAGMRQGAYTDLFALGGTVYFMLTGKAPTPAVMRAVRDTLPALSRQGETAFPGVSASFLRTIDWSLALAPDERPQDVEAMRQALRGELAAPEPSTRHVTAGRGVEFGPTAALARTELADSAAIDVTTPPPRVFFEQTTTGQPQATETTPPDSLKASIKPRLAAGLSIGAVLLALAIGGYALAPRAVDAADATAARIDAASAPPMAASATPIVTSASAPIATLVGAESATGKPPAASMPSSAASAASSAAPKAATVPARVDASSTAARASDGSKTKPSTTASVKPALAATTSTSSPSTSAPPAPTPTAAPAPAEACSSESGSFAKALCLSRVCQSPGMRDAPQCVEAQRIEEQRRQRIGQ